MATAADRLANNLNFGALGKATELRQRLLFTLGALIVFRLGTFLPIPGINPIALQQFFEQQSSGILGIFDTFSGGALGRMGIFALGIMPYISSSIIVQLLTGVSEYFKNLKAQGEIGRQKITQITRYGTVFLAAIQGYGLSVGLESSANLVINPGTFFKVSTVTSIVAGTIFLMWLGEQITARGIGNGISLIIMAGIVANLPSALGGTLELGRTGALSTGFIIFLLIMSVAVIYFIVFVERGQRRIIIQYPKRQRGNKMMGGDNSHLPLKINTAGVIPPIFASSILLMPITVMSFSAGQGPEWMTTLAAYLGRGQPVYLIIYISLVVFFAFFYTAIVFNPEETADNLKKNGGFVPGIRPGKNTAEYLDKVLTRLTVVGASYLAIICLLPELLISEYAVPFYFGGTSLLIVVTVTMDTVAQIQSHLLAHQYEGLIKKSRLRGRRG